MGNKDTCPHCRSILFTDASRESVDSDGYRDPAQNDVGAAGEAASTNKEQTTMLLPSARCHTCFIVPVLKEADAKTIVELEFAYPEECAIIRKATGSGRAGERGGS